MTARLPPLRPIVIKFGGNALSEDSLGKLTDAIKSFLAQSTHPPPLLLVHGGGPQINAMLETLAIPSHFVDGLRYTCDQTLAVAQMVLCGQVNPQFVRAFNQQGILAVGLNGMDADCVRGHQRNQNEQGALLDLGQVGQIDTVNSALFQDLFSAGYLPVLAPIASDGQGGALNINADDMASEVARALDAQALILMSNIAGVLDDDAKIIETLTATQIESLIAAGTISGGMIPKMRAAVRVLDRVEVVKMIDGRDAAILLSALNQQKVGTAVIRD